jgi:DNA-binding transcriptional regulator YiaG
METLQPSPIKNRSPVAERKRGKAAEAPAITSPRQLLGIKKRIFARLAGFSERAITDYESGKKVSDALGRRMKELVQLQKRLSRVVKASAIPDWLQRPNQAFDGLTPIEVVERGEIHRLYEMIYFLESGTAS